MPPQPSSYDTKLDLGLAETAGEVLSRIAEESRDPTEKGEWFEQLFCDVAASVPEYDITEIHRWRNWVDKQKYMPGFGNDDIGIDAVAKLNTGEWVAIQCKFYDRKQPVGKTEIDKFLGGSQHQLFKMRWIVTTSHLGPKAQKAALDANPQIQHIDFHDLLADQPVGKKAQQRPVREPWPQQQEAIDAVTQAFQDADRGKLIMACGTGKTFVSLRITEQIVPEGGTILFAAPSIALVSQARREWLRHTTRGINAIVVCSDASAGGKRESEDIGVHELECPVLDDPEEIADKLKNAQRTAVVFCTYQSLDKVTAAQQSHAAPAFDLALADEAHRTTGALTKASGETTNFQIFHHNKHLQADKRLYMTATPRVYTHKSKAKAEARGIAVADMQDTETYGRTMHRLDFRTAVKAGMLSDYRVIVLGVSEESVSPSLRAKLEELEEGHTPVVDEIARVKATSLAINGVLRGDRLDKPNVLTRTLVFANSIPRSKWYAKALNNSEIRRLTSRKMEAGARARHVEAQHLDGTDTAHTRNLHIHRLKEAGVDGKCQVISNVKLFTEGVDIPALDAVAFLDPRDSQVDIVQAVGRIMRRADEKGKRLGYIIVPVVIDPGGDMITTLAESPSKFNAIGKVLQALRSHDPRIAENPSDFILIGQVTGSADDLGDAPLADDVLPPEQLHLELIDDDALYAHVVAESGLGDKGMLVADGIAYNVGKAADKLMKIPGLAAVLANVLDMPEPSGGDEKKIQAQTKSICVVAALMLYNACLLHRRLRESIAGVVALERTGYDPDPHKVLDIAWELILERDYSPVFQPAREILLSLPRPETKEIIRDIAESANSEGDSLSKLGYDHAGPLYHKILGTAKSDGAFYTSNQAAVLLAHLAMPKDFMDWSAIEAVANLRIMDPACGTGTLLMSAMQTIKDRVNEVVKLDKTEQNNLYKNLVENAIHGLDINRHGIQLAACNLTLGAPTVDYQRMNLVTVPHGNQDGNTSAGSLEILMTEDTELDNINVLFPKQKSTIEALEGEQVDNAAQMSFSLRDLDMVIMNPPFTASDKRGTKFAPEARKAMQEREREIVKHLEKNDPRAASVIDSNSIQTFFAPLADMLLNKSHGVLAKVIPTTVCTGTASMEQRQFLADRFHVETIITSHDPKRINFSENTNIHETLIVCRRKTKVNKYSPTKFISLRLMPDSIKEAVEVAEEIQQGKTGKWVGSIYEHDEAYVITGDWRPCQFFDVSLYEAALLVDKSQKTVKLGDSYSLGPKTVYGYFDMVNEGDSNYKVFLSRSSKLRLTMKSEPEQPAIERSGKEETVRKFQNQAGNLLLAFKFDTHAGRLVALFSDTPALGCQWIPVDATNISREDAKALCAWFNSTLGILGFLNNRAGKLTNPTFNPAPLRNMPIPDFKQVSPDYLIDAYEQMKTEIVSPWKEATNDPLRDYLDQAAAETIGLDIAQVRDWRARLAKEPTISNERV